MSGFRQPRYLVADLLARPCLTAVASLIVPLHQVLLECKADRECFQVLKELFVGHYAKVALDTGKDVDLSGKAA